MKFGNKKGMLITLCVLGALFVYLLIDNWGIWWSTSYELFGVELPLKEIYATEQSGWQREGLLVTVYELPENTQAILDEEGINLQEYPMFSGFQIGAKEDRYIRIKWTAGPRRDDFVKMILGYSKQDIAEAAMPDLKDVSNGKKTGELACYLLQLPDTMCGGEYQDEGSCIGNYLFYIVNIKKRILIKYVCLC